METSFIAIHCSGLQSSELIMFNHCEAIVYSYIVKHYFTSKPIYLKTRKPTVYGCCLSRYVLRIHSNNEMLLLKVQLLHAKI
jgi:hypothetical protein